MLSFKVVESDTVSYGAALTWRLLLPVWKGFTSTRNQMYASATSRNPLQTCLVFHSILDLLQKTSFWANLTHPMTSFFLACERQTFLLAHHRWGTFRVEERLRLSDRNSIQMTQNLSRIRSEALIGRRCSFIVLAIVYEWQTKYKRPQRSNVNVMNL